MASLYPSGLGNDAQAMQATAAMRQEPWYQAMMKAWGINPAGDANGNVSLNEEQRQALRLAAEQHGIGFNNKFDEVDKNGQIIEGHHKLKKIAIGAAIGGLALTGLGAAGIGPLAGAMSGIGGAFGGGAAATAGGGAAATGGGLTTAGVLGGVGTALSAGQKIAGLFGAGKDVVNDFAATSAAKENQLANNRLIDAKVAQGGPAADAQAFRNQMRSAAVARMDPNAAPLSLNNHQLPGLVTPEGVAQARTLNDQLAARVAAGKQATTFGVPDPTQEELDARNKASNLTTAGNVINTGSKIAGLFGLGKPGNAVTTLTDLGGGPVYEDPFTAEGDGF